MSGRPSASISLSESFSDESIRTILKPIQQEKMTVEYICHYKAIAEFKQRVSLLESHYGNLYSRLAALEKEISKELIQPSSLSHPVNYPG